MEQKSNPEPAECLHIMTPMEMNCCRLFCRHTVLTPEKIEAALKECAKNAPAVPAMAEELTGNLRNSKTIDR